MKILLVLFLFFNSVLVFSQDENGNKTCKYQVVKDILELEYTEYMSIVDEDADLDYAYETLDAIVKGAKDVIEEYEANNLDGESINNKIEDLLSSDNKKEIIDIVENLLKLLQDYFLKDFNIARDLSTKNNLFFDLFKENDTKHLADCDIFSYLFYAIGLEYDLPIIPVLTNMHVFIVWKLEIKQYIKYETLWYEANFLPNNFFNSNEKFLKLDTGYKIKAIEYNNISTLWFYRRSYDNYKEYALDLIKKSNQIVKENNIVNKYLKQNMLDIIQNLPK